MKELTANKGSRVKYSANVRYDVAITHFAVRYDVDTGSQVLSYLFPTFKIDKIKDDLMNIQKEMFGT